jgi:hypothetical protein
VIGVIANLSEHNVVREFFELFKTPWELYQPGKQYDVILCNEIDESIEPNATLVVFYGSRESYSSAEGTSRTASRRKNRVVSYKDIRFPIYGDSVTFHSNQTALLLDEESLQPAGYQYSSSNGSIVARLGYDIFGEIKTLLTVGQPTDCAEIPTLDLHIELFRDLIVMSGVCLIEIPPVPEDAKFIACLTHDIDHPALRPHQLDHTVVGFLYRATLGSLVNFFRGRSSLLKLFANLLAALKLPFVFLGLAKDFWSGFEDRYLELEEGLASTFFVIPFKDNPGRRSQGTAPAFRASRYRAREIQDALRKLIAAGCEVGLHGIDAWMDPNAGKKELEEIRSVAEISEAGVRMHWLYFDHNSPVNLEMAGVTYDSTVGYNDTVGYRTGTTQAYKPFDVARLLELPMHVMDTALFYPKYMGLSEGQAVPVVEEMIKTVVRLGGSITINWHDRSLSPERLWTTSYRALIRHLKGNGAWFATAGQAIAWFRMRRSVVFEMDTREGNGRVTATMPRDMSVPRLQLRIYNSQQPMKVGFEQSSARCFDVAFSESTDIPVH